MPVFKLYDQDVVSAGYLDSIISNIALDAEIQSFGA
jgi:hypothetical protein